MVPSDKAQLLLSIPFMICTAPLRISLPLSSWLATDKLASSKQTIGNCCNLLATKAVKRIVLVLHLLQLISPSQRQKTTAANRTITFFGQPVRPCLS